MFCVQSSCLEHTGWDRMGPCSERLITLGVQTCRRQGRAQSDPVSFLTSSCKVKPTTALRIKERHVSISLLPPLGKSSLNLPRPIENLPRRKKPQLRSARVPYWIGKDGASGVGERSLNSPPPPCLNSTAQLKVSSCGAGETLGHLP